MKLPVCFPNEKADGSRRQVCATAGFLTSDLTSAQMLPEFVDLAPDQSELVVSFYFGNQRVILQIELQSLLKSCFLHVFAECHNLICPLAIAPAAGDIHPTMRRLKFMALWHMVLSQR